MNIWREVPATFRTDDMSFFAMRTPLTGCGFALVFGWLWFPSLRDVLLPCLFTGGVIFHPLAFGLALGMGCLLYGPLCERLENGDARQKFLNLVLAHCVPLLLFGLLLQCMGLSFAMLDATLMGLAGALPGVWWTSRLLALGPRKAVASLAWAALVALVLSLPLSQVQPDKTTTVCVLAASLALACLAALFLVGREIGYNEAEDTLPTAASLAAPHRFGPFCRIHAMLLCSVVLIFFGLGSLHVLFQETEATLHAFAQLCALTAAALLMDGSLDRMFGFAACSLTVLAFCLVLSPELTPILFPAGTGLLEALGAALCAAALRRKAFGQAGAASMAGLFLTLTLTAVNSGSLVGWQLTSFAGKAWPVLPGLAVAFLLAAIAYKGHKSMLEEDPSTQEEMELEPPLPSAASATTGPATAAINPSLAEQLTRREQFLAFLLINGYSNKAAAESLGLTDNTLRWHIKKLNKKAGTTDRAELITILKNSAAAPASANRHAPAVRPKTAIR